MMHAAQGPVNNPFRIRIRRIMDLDHTKIIVSDTALVRRGAFLAALHCFRTEPVHDSRDEEAACECIVREMAKYVPHKYAYETLKQCPTGFSFSVDALMYTGEPQIYRSFRYWPPLSRRDGLSVNYLLCFSVTLPLEDEWRP